LGSRKSESRLLSKQCIAKIEHRVIAELIHLHRLDEEISHDRLEPSPKPAFPVFPAMEATVIPILGLALLLKVSVFTRATISLDLFA